MRRIFLHGRRRILHACKARLDQLVASRLMPARLLRTTFALAISVLESLVLAQAQTLPHSLIDEACRLRAVVPANCDPEALYYTVRSDGERDFAAARQCALAQYARALKLCDPAARKTICQSDCFKSDDSERTPAEILMNLYVNGLGVQPDPALAELFARQATSRDDAESWIAAMRAWRKNKAATNKAATNKVLPGYFDRCDFAPDRDPTSAYDPPGAHALRDNVCVNQEFDSEVSSFALRKAHRLTAGQKQAFDHLQQVTRQWIENDSAILAYDGHSQLSMIALVTQQRRENWQDWVDVVDRMFQGTVSNASELSKADRKLNAVYRLIRERLAMWNRRKLDSTFDTFEFGYLNLDFHEIQKAQRNWIAYRDAFARFVQVVAPNRVNDVLAILTQQRVRALQEYLDVLDAHPL
jgi:uncharacterized protein YecT (DUF1311 family)